MQSLNACPDDINTTFHTKTEKSLLKPVCFEAFWTTISF